MELRERRQARDSVSKLYHRLWPQYQLAPFHDKVCQPLDRFINGTERRVIINLPPGHLKSMLASMVAPAGYIGKFPDGQYIGGSYNTELAKKFGREVRNIVASSDFHASFPDVWLRKDSKSAGRWNTNMNGSYISAAVQKSVTGNRANRLGIDDPHADFIAGNDRRQTDRDWEWFISLYTRLMPGSGIAIVMQRMSTHDMTARALELGEKKGQPWTLITLPAIADRETGKAIKYDGTKTGREELAKGIPLWGDFFTMEILLDFAYTFGPAKFNAMYQQIPEELAGKIIQPSWIMHWSRAGQLVEGRVELPKRFDEVVQTWDMRFKKHKSGSYVVGQVWGFFGEYKALLDQVRGQWGFEESCKNILSVSSKWPQAKTRLLEAKANGHAAEDRLQKKLKIKLVEVGGGDKAARLMATQSDWSNQTVLLPPMEEKDFDWVSGYRSRILDFPAEPNDEGDATSQVLNWWDSRSRFKKSLED